MLAAVVHELTKYGNRFSILHRTHIPILTLHIHDHIVIHIYSNNVCSTEAHMIEIYSVYVCFRFLLNIQLGVPVRLRAAVLIF